MKLWKYLTPFYTLYFHSNCTKNITGKILPQIFDLPLSGQSRQGKTGIPFLLFLKPDFSAEGIDWTLNKLRYFQCFS